MKKTYKPWKPKPASLQRVQDCNTVISSYLAQGYRLTLRQLYYQLVSKNIIANTEKEYRALSSLLSRARLAGLVDWDAIEDRVRQPWQPLEYESLEAMIEDACRTHRLPRWHGQLVYAELWVEKDALAGVLQPLAYEYHTTLMVNRGYSSQSAMKASADRINDNMERFGAQGAVIFYLGDLDPSGEDMVRDIQDRMAMFQCPAQVIKVALTAAQVKQHKPPPNPAKLTDSRAADYVAKHGYSSWEVDALQPNTLHALIRAGFDAVIDQPMMDMVIEEEERDKQAVQDALERILEDRAEGA